MAHGITVLINDWVLVRDPHDLDRCEICEEPYCEVHDMHFFECPCVTEFQIDSGDYQFETKIVNGIKWARIINGA